MNAPTVSTYSRDARYASYQFRIYFYGAKSVPMGVTNRVSASGMKNV